jgi:RimJ/RimL family protein N-acetyltransferase
MGHLIMTAEIPTITTSRLILRPLELSDADAVQELFPQWEIVRFLDSHIPWPYPADGALTFIRDIALPAIQQGTEWHWSIRLKTAPERLISMISLISPKTTEAFGSILPCRAKSDVGGKHSGHGLLVRDP